MLVHLPEDFVAVLGSDRHEWHTEPKRGVGRSPPERKVVLSELGTVLGHVNHAVCPNHLGAPAYFERGTVRGGGPPGHYQKAVAPHHQRDHSDALSEGHVPQQAAVAQLHHRLRRRRIVATAVVLCVLTP